MKRKFKTLKPLIQDAGIYIIFCSETKKVYIGESLNISARIVKHFSRLRNKKHNNPILQNIFNKYGEETFFVDVLKYSNFDKTLLKEEKIQILKTDEEFYQRQYGNNCISMDRNEFVITTVLTEDQINSNKKQLDSIRDLALNAWRIPLIIYDIKNNLKIEVDSVESAKSYIEQKHIYRNIKDKVYLPYKGRYVAFLPNEFDPQKILRTRCKNNAVSRNIYTLFNLKTGEIIKFPSKIQFSLYFSNSKNSKLYDKYKNTIDNNFLTSKLITTMEEFWNSDFMVHRTSRSIKICNVKTYYNAIKNYTNQIELGKIIGVDRHTISEMLKHKSIEERILELEKTAGHLPNLFKNWETSSL